MSRPESPHEAVERGDKHRRDASPELVEIRRKLRDRRELVLDEDLRHRVDAWIKKSWDTNADTAAEYVESRLNGLLEEYPMYAGPDVEDGQAFPDACNGCPHKGSRCPLLMGAKAGARERLIEQADTEADVRRVYEQQSRDTGCRVVPRALGEWDNHHSEFIQEGDELLQEIADQALAGGDV